MLKSKGKSVHSKKMVIEQAKKSHMSETPEDSDNESVVNEGDEYCLKADKAFHGHSEAQDYEKAKTLYFKARELGSAKALVSLARMYENGIGVEQDYDEAFRLYKEGVELKSAACMFALGKYHELGLIPKGEPTRGIHDAISYYEYAANEMYPEALTKIGYMYENGIYYEKSMESALEMYESAAKQNDGLAKNYLGLYYYNRAKKTEDVSKMARVMEDENKIKQDYTKAVQLFKEGRDLGCVRAANNLGMCYERGIGVERDIEEAYECYLEAASEGFSQGMFSLGYLLFEKAKINRLNEDYEKAAYWLRATLDKDPKHPQANFYLGCLFEEGLGVNKDYQSALLYFKRADELGFSKAAVKCGNLLSKQHGLLKPNKTEALRYYKKVTIQNDPEAYFGMGKLYEEGCDEVKKDEKLALQNYEKAHQLGNTEAGVMLSYMYGNGIGVKKDVVRAKQYLIEASNNGSEVARKHLINHGIFTISQKESKQKILLTAGSFAVPKTSLRRSSDIENVRKRSIFTKSSKEVSGGFTSTLKGQEEEVIENKKELMTIESYRKDYNDDDQSERINYKDFSAEGSPSTRK